MEVVTVNVGQGALAIVRHRGEAVIVDARIPPSGDDTVVNVTKHLATFLKDHSLRGLVLTGFDKDHADVRGVALVLRKYRPDWIVFPDYDKDTEEYGKVQDVIKDEIQARRNSRAPLRSVPVTLDSIPSRFLEGLSSCWEFQVFSPHPDDMDTSNNCGLVIRMEGIGEDGFSYLVTGDTENARWEVINRFFGAHLRSDVMAAPHHGAKGATNGQTLGLVEPNTVLISAGVSNPYGHPDSGVVQACLRVARHVFATNSDGGQSLFTRRKDDDFETVAFTG